MNTPSPPRTTQKNIEPSASALSVQNPSLSPVISKETKRTVGATAVESNERLPGHKSEETSETMTAVREFL